MLERARRMLTRRGFKRRVYLGEEFYYLLIPGQGRYLSAVAYPPSWDDNGKERYSIEIGDQGPFAASGDARNLNISAGDEEPLADGYDMRKVLRDAKLKLAKLSHDIGKLMEAL